MISNKALGTIGFIGAPFLFVDFLVNGLGDVYVSTSLGGVFSLLYMSAWMCSVIVLHRLNASGNTGFGKYVLLIQLLFLSLANTWNIWIIINPQGSGVLFRILDMFWPISNLFMIVTGITIARKRRIAGWRRFVPLVVGFWFPISILCLVLMPGKTLNNALISGIYSTLSWAALAYAVATAKIRPAPLVPIESEFVFNNEFAVN
ncbi:MAG TPA: hypothetical protein VEZ55_07955 [Chitinophagaceae bacterium]|jgi:hypothetical protein|nr:hypothetical protein [Chitinophagaceae bacterium]